VLAVLKGRGTLPDSFATAVEVLTQLLDSLMVLLEFKMVTPERRTGVLGFKHVTLD
jgi:hypothetical protein